MTGNIFCTILKPASWAQVRARTNSGADLSALLWQDAVICAASSLKYESWKTTAKWSNCKNYDEIRWINKHFPRITLSMDYIHHYSMHCYYFLIPWKNLLTIQQLHDVLLQMSSIHLTGSSLQANGKLWRHLKVENRPVALWWVCVIVSCTQCHQKGRSHLNRGESEVKSLFP